MSAPEAVQAFGGGDGGGPAEHDVRPWLREGGTAIRLAAKALAWDVRRRLESAPT